MKLPFFWSRDNETLEFKKTVALTEEAKENTQAEDPIEAIKKAERERLMLGDERVSNWLDQHASFHAFIPALAPVNRTTKHISKVDAQVAWLDFQILCTLEEMCMSPDVYEAGGLEMLQGLEMMHSTQVSDGWEGWKGRILTEERKVVRAELKK